MRCALSRLSAPTVAGCVLSALCLLTLANTARADDLAIVGATLYTAPDAPGIADSAVLVHDGKILAAGARAAIAIPSGYTVLDRPNSVITAGFWNSHVHLTTPALLRPASLSDMELSQTLQSMFVRWGFTTVFDLASTMASTNAIRGRIENGHVDGPNILTVGEPFYPAGATPIYARPLYRDGQLASAEIRSTPQAVARVDKQVREGANGIKLVTGATASGEVGVLPAAQVRAITQAAHKLGKPVFAHLTNQVGLDTAIDNGVDILAHTVPLSGPWQADMVARLKAHHIALIPTLTLFKVYPSADTPMETALQQVQAQAQAGGEILFGTGAGFMEVYDTTEEYRLLGKVLDWRAILASLTTAPAHRFGKGSSEGRVLPGFVADLVVLSADPEKDVTAFAQVHDVIHQGTPIYGPEAAVQP